MFFESSPAQPVISFDMWCSILGPARLEIVDLAEHGRSMGWIREAVNRRKRVFRLPGFGYLGRWDAWALWGQYHPCERMGKGDNSRFTRCRA